jgi:hypothetical protein
MRTEVGAERMYILTFDPTRATPTSTGTSFRYRPAPYEEQQGTWTSWSRGVFEITREEIASLAVRIAERLG